MKFIFSAHAVLSWMFGLILLFVPAAIAAAYGITLNPGTAVLARLIGATFVGLGVLAWLARAAAPSEALRAILLGYAVINTLGCLVSSDAVLSGAGNALGWTIVVLFGFFGVSFGTLATEYAPVVRPA